ncbi:winged helix-turn-helix domain-containing protein [Pantoea ananatis]|uniref:winged helix-turn-helix domain-containing protein n=1 Tax=Pantoea ananas TaxID=553 RepID=UPI00067DE5AA|nr:winged helix-turn-helix domain-containing protein [Pantoea ananatis]
MPKYLINNIVVFESEKKTLQLLNDEESIYTLSNPATRLLMQFIKYGNEPIERDILLKETWEDYGFRASNSNLNTYVSELRKAFKSLGENNLIIATLPKHGFQFVAQVKELPVYGLELDNELMKNMDLKRNSYMESEDIISSESNIFLCNKIIRSKYFFVFSLLSVLVFSLCISQFYFKMKSNHNLHDMLLFSGVKDGCILILKSQSKNYDSEDLTNILDKFVKENLLTCNNSNDNECVKKNNIKEINIDNHLFEICTITEN